MTYNPELDHRRSNRLRDYDYSQGGAYFVTSCTHNKRSLFGEIANEVIILNTAGAAANACWLEIPAHFPDAQLDLFVIMPNHVHGIIFLHGAPQGANDHSPLQVDRQRPHGTSHTIGSVVRGFKIGVSKWFRENRGEIETVWQRSYYERVIRNDDELNMIRQYILDNPVCRD